jgi:hypothetical protein
MYRCTRMTAPIAVLALSAFLASGAAAQDVPRAQTSADDRSYLPPWMRQQAKTGPVTMQSQYLSAIDDPALKQKATQQPPQKQRRRHGLLDMFSW